jgi:hypothetical protein
VDASIAKPAPTAVPHRLFELPKSYSVSNAQHQLGRRLAQVYAKYGDAESENKIDKETATHFLQYIYGTQDLQGELLDFPGAQNMAAWGLATQLPRNPDTLGIPKANNGSLTKGNLTDFLNELRRLAGVKG